MIRRVGPFVLLMLLGQAQYAPAQVPTGLNRQIASIREIRDIALSPDGRTVATTILDPTLAGGRPHIWSLSLKVPSRQITGSGGPSDGEESDPAWAPDGRAIFYLRKHGGSAVVARMMLDDSRVDTLELTREGAAAGGWGLPASSKALVAKGFAIAPTGRIAVWAADPSNASRKDDKDDHHLVGQSESVRLYLLDDSSGAPREIKLDDNVRTVVWSKDGRRLLVITAPPSDDLGASNRLWLIEGAQAPREIDGTAENVQTVSWLPDGRIAYLARCSHNAPIVCRDLFVQGLDGTKPRNLTADIDGSVINGLDNGAKTGPVVTAGGDILLTVARGFDQQLARIRPVDGRISWIGTQDGVVKAVSANVDNSRFALLAAPGGGSGTVQVADAHFRRFAQLVVPELQPAAWEPLRARKLKWASDGYNIDGLLYLPDGIPSGGRVPLVVDAHGGPAGRFEDIDYPLVRLLLAQGWAVLHVNPRGSLGYGAPFLASLQDDLGGADYRDIMRGLDVALAAGPLDPDRLALIGFSYGATVTSFALGRTERFKGLVAAAPVVDQISEYGTEGSSWYDRWYFGQPWRRLEAAWRQSPLAGVANARTPLLLLHGDADSVNPLGQSLELYRALRQEGSPVELMLFPRETHHELGQNFYGSPSVEPFHGIALRQRIVDFLADAFSGKRDAGLTRPESPR